MYNHTGERPLRGGRESQGAHRQRQGVAAELYLIHDIYNHTE